MSMFVVKKVLCEAKKLHHFIFAVNLSDLSILQSLLVYMYTLINLEQNDIKTINLL